MNTDTLVLYTIVCPASLMGSFLLLISIAVTLNNDFTQSKRSHISNIFWIAFCNFIFNLNGSVTPYFYYHIQPPHHVTCTIRGFVHIFFKNGSLVWYFIVSLNIFLSIRKSSFQNYMKNRIVLHLCVWSFLFILAMVPIQHYKRQDDGHCSFDPDWMFWHIVCMTPLFPSLLLGLIVLYLISHLPISKGDKQRSILYRTIVFVAVFVITWLPILVIYIIELLFQFHDMDRKVLFPYKLIAHVLLYLDGAFNFFVWFLYFSDLRNGLLYKWRRRKMMDKTILHPLVSRDEEVTNDGSINTKTFTRDSMRSQCFSI